MSIMSAMQTKNDFRRQFFLLF